MAKLRKADPRLQSVLADTGTLEARIEKELAANRAWTQTNDGLDVAIDLLDSNADALRDALAELRRLRAEIAINKHARALSLLGRSSEQEAREEGLREKLAEAEIRAEQAEARASSPDRRALVEKCREKERAYARAAAHHNDPQVGFANICKWFADELEASLTGTGEQK